jgi:hypothetical protein
VDDGIVRIHGGEQGAALSAQRATGAVQMTQPGTTIGEFWRFLPLNPAGDVAWLESVAFPGQLLSVRPDGSVGIEYQSDARARDPLLAHQPSTDSQQWVFRSLSPPGTSVGPSLGANSAVARMAAPNAIESRLIPYPPLPPAEIDFENSSRRELWVLLADRRNGKPPRALRIPAGSAVRISLDRDPGARLQEVHQIQRADGSISEVDFVVELPIRTYYDVSVYELMLKSIAIDRTGKSPNPVEEMNFQPRSLGWYLLPAGNALTSGRHDVYEKALRSGNPGGVRRLTAADYRTLAPQPDRPDILEQVLDSVRK